MSEKLTLFVCHIDDGGPPPHACKRAQRALRAEGHDFDKVIAGRGIPFAVFTTGRRPKLRQLSGQEKLPVLHLADGTTINGSANIIAWARAHAPTGAGRRSSTEVSTFARANRFQRSIRRLAASGRGSWLAARVAARIDPPVFRLTRGRHTASSLVSGLPVVFLRTTGARSGKPRMSPVMAFPTDEGLVVIASNYGQARSPAWYHNLLAHPEGEVVVNGQAQRFRAHLAAGEQRARIWRQGLTIYPGWASYERRANNRQIAVFVLDLV